MTRRSITLASVAVIAAGSAYLSTPPPAAASDLACTEAQWQEAAAQANEVCPGASFMVSCKGSTLVVTIVACPAGQG